MPVWRYSYTLLMWLLFFTSGIAYAQNPPFIHYTAENGLPSNNVYHVYRDSKGFLWFATDKGISCYNGLKFENYTTANGLADNEVFFFQEDYEQRLWMATYNGELCYYKDGVFHTAKNTPYLKIPIKSSFTKYIRLEADSSITFTFYDESKFLNIRKNKTRIYTVQLENYWERCYKIKKKKLANGSFLLESRRSVQTIDSNSQLLKQELFEKLKDFHYTFSQDQQYLNDGKKIYSENEDSIGLLPAKLPAGAAIYNIYSDGCHLFISTKIGLYVDDEIYGFQKDKVSCVTQDNEGNYWVATLNNGVSVFPKNLNNKIISNAYSGLISYGYLIQNIFYFINGESRMYTLTHDTTKILFDFSNYFSESGKKYKSVLSFLADSNNTFYLFSDNPFLVIARKLLTPTHHIIEKYKKEDIIQFSAKSEFINGKNIYLRRPTQIALLNLDNINNDKQIRLKYLINYETEDRIFAMAQRQNKSVWFSTIDKFYKIEDTLPVQQKQFNGLSFKNFNFFNDILVGYDHHNKLFVCRDIDTKLIVDSIPDQNCVWENFCQIDSLHLLISTNNLYRLLTLPSKHSAHTAIRAIENPFIPILAEKYYADSAYCYFFKKGDITKISISDILKPAPAPILFFRNIKTADNKYPINSTVNISYNESKNISIKIATLTSNNRNITYQYSISQNDTVWRNTTSDEINLANPTFGTYTIKVRAKTLSGGFSAPIEFKLIIARPFWATWWFICITLTALISVTILIIRYRIRLAYKKSSIEKEKEIRYIKSEFKALNALMNPHFIFNTLNNVQSLVNKDEKRAANEYIRIFADLVRQNMHNTSLELIPLQEEMELVGNYLKLEKLRYKELLNYTITIDEQTDINDVMVPPLLVQPLVENSIKHGLFHRKKEDSYILIDITEKDNKLTILVKDNGIGLSAAQQRNDPAHQSFGLENIRKRLHHASIIQNRKITLDLTEEMDEKGMHWTVVTIQIEL